MDYLHLLCFVLLALLVFQLWWRRLAFLGIHIFQFECSYVCIFDADGIVSKCFSNHDQWVAASCISTYKRARAHPRSKPYIHTMCGVKTSSLTKRTFHRSLYTKLRVFISTYLIMIADWAESNEKCVYVVYKDPYIYIEANTRLSSSTHKNTINMFQFVPQ